MARLREREVDNKLVITENEIDSLLASEQQNGRGDEVNLSHILVVVPENASPEQVQSRRARAEEALGQLTKGTDFRQVAAAYSERPTRCRAARWDGAPVSACPPSSTMH